MKVQILGAAGFEQAIRAMRCPWESWSRSDTHDGVIGPDDKELSMALLTAGAEHAKHLRLIVAWLEIDAPRYWWQEFDTYRHGVEKVSTSTIHTLMRTGFFSRDMFENGEYFPESILAVCNHLLSAYGRNRTEEERKLIKHQLKSILPEGFKQKRVVMVSYAALASMYRQRKNHPLNEWHVFLREISNLPHADLFMGDESHDKD